jgi:molecular chaperone GrpE
VLSTLRQWLLDSEQWRYALAAPPEAGEAGAEVDMHMLLEEMIALKQEVRLEARGGKTARQELDRAIDGFQEGLGEVQQLVQRQMDPLLRDRDRLREDLSGQIESQRRSWVELTLDVREALLRGRDASQQAGRRLGWRRCFLPRGILDGLLEGYGLALQRIDSVLEARGVREIACVGRRVDPERMRVVDVVADRETPEGHVIEVLRSGYTCGDRVIRYAEVRASGGSP